MAYDAGQVMVTAEPRVRVATRRPGVDRPAITDTREVEIELRDTPDVVSGMRSFAPRRGTIRFVRRFRDGEWSAWRGTVTLEGPRRLTAGNLSLRIVCEATFRDDASQQKSLVMPEYLRALVDEHRPNGPLSLVDE